jgi:hypothetical protein
MIAFLTIGGHVLQAITVRTRAYFGCDQAHAQWIVDSGRTYRRRG